MSHKLSLISLIIILLFSFVLKEVQQEFVNVNEDYKFVLKATTFDNLYIANKKNNNNHFRELDKNSNGEFIGEDVYIFGDEVYISTLKGNTYSHIVQYKTIRNPNVAVDASYPDSFSAPKNVLYSPLIDFNQEVLNTDRNPQTNDITNLSQQKKFKILNRKRENIINIQMIMSFEK